MIVHRPRKRTADKSSFSKLVNYISREKAINTHNGLKITHCQTDDIELACSEVMDTQSMNKRTTQDKTYHLVVSFSGR